MKGCRTIWIPVKAVKLYFLLSILFTTADLALAQETIFTLLKTDAKKADAYYSSKNYRKALDLYLTLADKSNDDQFYLQIARSYYYMNQPKDAARWYARFLSENKVMPAKDIFFYAETFSALKQYDLAIQWYSQYLGINNNDPAIIKKIWRLKNREYLYEDSIHYTVKLLNTNSDAGDLCPVMHREGLIFMSNRKRQTVVDQVDANNLPFYKLYLSRATPDTINNELIVQYEKPMLFCKELNARFNEGPVALYNDQQRMIYTATGDPSEKDKGKRTLQLYFAALQGETWEITAPFVYNSKEYSITDPAISKDGTVLYFSSDMNGGFGGKDLYKSSFINSQWTKPVNLGDQINTSGDESFPFIHGNSLYFASNGQAGLGGLDIFHATIEENGFGEVLNIGYPINTNFDDFAITLNDDGTKGYFSSNRGNHGDDVYALAIDLQSYPLLITGILKYKEESWKDSAELKILPKAQLFLIDNIRNITVQSSTSDTEGKFSLMIPYFSQYRIKVVGSNNRDEAFVSLELSKGKNSGSTYEIVIVKNIFKNP